MTPRARVKRASAPRGGASSARDNRAIDPESLLHVPLIARALRDPRVTSVRRALDARWTYARFVRNTTYGFRPFAGQVFYAARSSLAGWRADPGRSARDFNLADRLVDEALFFVHDYLHAWSYGLLRALRPKSSLGYGAITERNFEELVFLHLVTETVATVGLDYWFLSTTPINDLCPIGTSFGPLTVAYREEHIAEFRRARPDLVVQHKGFFFEKTRFYCSGVFPGFDANDLARSPLIYAWLTKELRYGARQRRYIREWLGFMSGVAVPDDRAARPVECDSAWQRKLIREVGTRLWALVKDGVDSELVSIDPADAWESAQGAFDPRFSNVRYFEADDAWAERSASLGVDQRTLAMEQALLRFDFDRFDRSKGPKLLQAIRAGDLASFRALTAGEARLTEADDAPRDLFYVG